eukprot:GHVP01040169.1.p1 GENE.GHVP01040169.1~~GHVP01040169.1.p1  ORF type:complete len:316 (+),score=54.29 GHVP01040169.1:34-981(+)
MKIFLIAFISTFLSKAKAINTATGEYTPQAGGPPEVASNECSELNLEWLPDDREGSMLIDPAYAVLQSGDSGDTTTHPNCGFIYTYIGENSLQYFFVVAAYADTEDYEIYLNPYQCQVAAGNAEDKCNTPVEIDLLPRVYGTYTLDANDEPEDVTVCEDYKNIDWTEVRNGDSEQLTDSKYAVILGGSDDCGSIFVTQSFKTGDLAYKYTAIVGFRDTDESELVGSLLLSNTDCDSCDLSSLIFARQEEDSKLPTTTTEDPNTTEGITTTDTATTTAGIVIPDTTDPLISTMVIGALMGCWVAGMILGAIFLPVA